jgi:hypothetical protein
MESLIDQSTPDASDLTFFVARESTLRRDSDADLIINIPYECTSRHGIFDSLRFAPNKFLSFIYPRDQSLDIFKLGQLGGDNPKNHFLVFWQMDQWLNSARLIPLKR